jgi:hypothetical protein
MPPDEQKLARCHNWQRSVSLLGHLYDSSATRRERQGRWNFLTAGDPASGPGEATGERVPVIVTLGGLAGRGLPPAGRESTPQ